MSSKARNIKVNVTTSASRRTQFSGWMTSHEGRRDLKAVFGYTYLPTVSDFMSRYKRQNIAKRVIEAYPKACWSSTIDVTDDLNGVGESLFEKAFKTLMRKKNVLDYIRRADILAGIGSFSILVIGVRDGKTLDTPLVTKIKNIQDVLYIKPYSEVNVMIDSFETDSSNPRYGQPIMYSITTGGYSGYVTGSVPPVSTVKVHYTRVVHIAEGLLENEVYGTPRLEAVLDIFDDLLKITGGSAETFYLNARGALIMKMEGMSNLSDKASQDLDTTFQEFTDNLTRYLKVRNMDVSALNFNVADPEKHFNMIIQLISGTTGIPRRILTGSEMGQLASEQDESNWVNRVVERQKDFCEWRVLRPIINFFIDLGTLPKPLNSDYDVIWGNVKKLSELEKADIAVKRANALGAYVNGRGSDLVMSARQFMEEVMGMPYLEQELSDISEFDILDGIEKTPTV